MRRTTVLALLTAALPAALSAQGHEHVAGMVHPTADSTATGAAPASGGQAAFAAIGEIVRILDADPATDWTRVNVEALRQHLIDMDEVTLRSAVRTVPVAGGARFEVRGASPATIAAIQRMAAGHGATLQADPRYRVTVARMPAGADMTVLAASDGDARAAARIRGLGFAGLLTVGAHHASHHLALARGESPHAHQ